MSSADPLKQDFITIALPFADRDGWSALHEADVTALVEELGNPAGDAMRKALDALECVHFMSINVIRAESPQARAHLLIEATVDGDARAAIRRIADVAGHLLFPPIALACNLASRDDLLPLLLRHHHPISHKPLRWPGTLTGLPFLGVPGLPLREVLDNERLTGKARLAITPRSTGAGVDGPQTIFSTVRAELLKDPALKAILERPQPALSFGEKSDAPWLASEREASGSFLGHFVQPVLQVVVIALVVPYLLTFATLVALGRASAPLSFASVVEAALLALFPAVVVVAGLALALILALRADEQANTPVDATPDPGLMARMMERENHPGSLQNHMISVTTMRPGLVRRIALMVTFHAVAIAPRLGLMRVGFLATIGTIHSARWVILPGTRQNVFLSNYDGSWESYLEDFVTKSSPGVTGVWSNTEGFPATRNLFWKGAEDGDRMKRFARRSMQPTAFWYSAYPKLTCEQIRKHAIIASGLRCHERLASSPSDAEAWLDLFSTIPRPDYGLEYEEIQTLMFGGLGRHRHGRCLALSFGAPQPPLPDDPYPWRHVQGWLAALSASGIIAFGDQPPGDFVANIAFSASGLRKLGLDRELAVDPGDPAAPCPEQSFPAPFALGMTHPSRRQLLNDPAALEWDDNAVDAVLLLYARGEDAAARFDAEAQRATDAGLAVVRQIDTALIPFEFSAYQNKWFGRTPAADAPAPPESDLTMEPFGFVDGISQPSVRGFPARGGPDPVHAVEPGEFILGYRDNRGYFPPSPQVTRKMDALGMHPGRLLPSVPDALPTRFPLFEGGPGHLAEARDFGRNGSYLVIRQLAQNVAGFERQLDRLSAMVENDPLNPQRGNPVRTREWVAAKLVGRWRDGSALVEHPFAPALKAQAPRSASNRFLYRDEDPQGMRCPFGAHVRRSFPRDSMSPNDPFELSVTNRHRLLRRGRPYLGEDGKPAGTLFLCFNADLERQFEFVQQTWVGSPVFHGLEREVDPFAAHAGPGGLQEKTQLSLPGPSAPLVLPSLERTVRLLGGGYFFMPGRHAFWFLAGQAWQSGQGGNATLAR